MANPFLGEIKMVAFDYPPKGWAACNGQLLPLAQYQALFSLLGTTYGGDGRTNFALPDLRGRVPLHEGQGIALGQSGGEAAHTLVTAEIPAHTHILMARAAPATTSAAGVVPGPTVALAEAVAAGTTSANVPNFGTGTSDLQFAANAIGSGGGQPHPNQQPFAALTFCISLTGIFPSR